MAPKTKPYSSCFLAKEHKFDSLVNNLNKLGMGLSVINREMRIVWVSQIMLDGFGPANKIYGQHCYEIYNHREKVCPNCPTVKAFRSGKAGFSAIQRAFDKDGNKRYYQLTTTPIKNNGKVVEVLELVQDVTEDVLSEKEKEQFQKQLKEANVKRALAIKDLTVQTKNLSKAKDEIKKLNDILRDEVSNKTFELNTAIKELDTVYTVSREIISTLDLQEVFSLITKVVCSIINTKGCVLRMLDRTKRELPIVSTYGVSEKYIDNMPLKVGEGLSGIVVTTAKPIVCPQVDKEESMKYSYYISREGYESAIGVPIIFKEEVLGTIVTYDEHVRNYTKTEVMLLSTFASQVAVAIKNAQLYKKVHTNYFDTVHTLVLAMEARDPYTHGHSERVTEYAIEIAKSIGLSKKQIKVIQDSGKLHDVGKIAIPDNILRKPGPLTAEEKEIIRMHPVKGVDMLTPLKFLESGFSIIKYHHERFDGRGYPSGLKERAIPVLARIFACADAFDAMTSDRPYRLRMTFKQAIIELEKNAGTQFDPYLVKRFIMFLKRKR